MIQFFIRNFYLSGIILISSCSNLFDPKVIDEELPDGSAKLCINSYFCTDSSWLVNVTAGKYILSTAPEFRIISDATVTINEDGQPLSAFSYNADNTYGNSDIKGWYESSSPIPRAEKTYKIIVSAPGFGNATASCYIPAAVSVSKVDIISKIPIENYMIPVDVYFNDPPGIENFYEIHSRLTSTDSSPGNEYVHTQESKALTDDPLFYNAPSRSLDILDPPVGLSHPVLFADTGFEGRLIKVRCLIRYLPPGPGEPPPYRKTIYEVVLRTLSKDFYLNKISKNLQRWIRDDPFAQPVQVHSNVQNGFGIFAGTTASVFLLDL